MTTPKTLVVFTDYETLPKFFVIEGDKRNWHGVVVNAGHEGHEGTDEDYDKACAEIVATFDLNSDYYPGKKFGPDGQFTKLSEAFAFALDNSEHECFTATCGWSK